MPGCDFCEKPMVELDVRRGAAVCEEHADGGPGMARVTMIARALARAGLDADEYDDITADESKSSASVPSN